MKQLKNVLIGADIEVFLKEKHSSRIVSAEGYIKGTKHEPFVFDPSNKYFAISLDNVSAEFCIPPTNHVDEWVSNLFKSLNYINQTIPETLCTVAQPAAILDMEFLQTENAQKFGCEPDYNVYLREPNAKPEAVNERLRSAGGHIHIGYDGADDGSEEGVLQCEAIIKAMDLFLGVPSVIQEPENDRKKLYGKAGAFRFKPYGVEYRTISNYYLEKEQLMRWAFQNAMKAVDFLNDGGYEEIASVSASVIEAINGNNKVIAGNLIRQFNIEMAS